MKLDPKFPPFDPRQPDDGFDPLAFEDAAWSSPGVLAIVAAIVIIAAIVLVGIWVDTLGAPTGVAIPASAGELKADR